MLEKRFHESGRGQNNQEWSSIMCKYIISLLFVAALLLPTTSGVQAGTAQNPVDPGIAKTLEDGNIPSSNTRSLDAVRKVQFPKESSQRLATGRDGCQTVYYYDDTCTYGYAWPLPQDSSDWFAVRFTNDEVTACTLTVIRIKLFRPFMTGTPDLHVCVYDDDGFGLPGAPLASATVANNDLPPENFGWAEVDLSVYNIVFGAGTDFHIGITSIGGVGDTLYPLSDAGTGPYAGEDRSETHCPYDGLWYTLNSLYGVDFVFMFEAEMCCVTYASISGTKFHDENGNSVWEPGLGEGVLDNVTINLHGSLDAGGTVDLSTVTDAQGDYLFSGLTPGDYYVLEDVKSWWTAQTYPLTVFHTVADVQWGDNLTDYDFGNDTLCEGSVTSEICLHGTEDNFVGPETSYVSPSLLAWLQTQYDYITDFDQPADNQAFGHTFQDCWNDQCVVMGATLRIKLRGSAGGTSTDFLVLGDYDQPSIGRIWSMTIGDLDAYFGGDGVWNYNEVAEFTLDLANLPPRSWLPTNILAALQDGNLDIIVSDDTEVDFIEIEVELCCPDTCYADGDVNNDGMGLTTGDLSDLIAYLSGNGSAPVPPYSADLNGDGIIDGKDVQVYKNYFIYGMSVFAPYGGYPVMCPCDPILAPMAMYLHSIEGGGNRGPGEVIAGIPFIINIGLMNGTSDKLLQISNGIRFYSPNDATWEPVVYGYYEDFPAESFFDVVWSGDFSNTGSGADTVGFLLNATTLPGVNGYDDILLRLSTVAHLGQAGDTICIDSSFYPPDGDWQWQTASYTITPVWDGPHCFEILEYVYDTVLAYSTVLASFGTAELTENPDSSVTVSNLGDGGSDGVTLEFDETPTVIIGLSGPNDIPAGGAIGGFLIQYLDKCCWDPTDVHKDCLYLGTKCLDFHNCVAYGWPHPFGICEPAIAIGPIEYMRGPGNMRSLIVVPSGSDSATVYMDGYNDPAGFTLYVYEGGGLVDSVDCDAGTTIITGRTMPTAMSIGGMSAMTWASSMDFVIEGGGVLHGDELRSRPHSATRTSEMVSRAAVLGAGLSEFVISGVETIPCCQGIRGNVDGDPEDLIDISDLVYLVDYMFTGGSAPTCWEEANVDGNGLDDDSGIDISDLVYLVDYMFNGGPAPVSCGTTVKAGKAITRSSDISFDIDYADGVSTVVMNSSIDLRGIQLELKGTGPAPANLVGEHVDMIQGRDGWVVKVGLLDLDGGEIISADTREVVRFEGKYTLEAVIIADVNARSITPTIGTALKQTELPTVYTLSQNYPNPFNPSTSISFALPEAAEVRLEVFNLLGQRVTTLLNQRLEAGNHTAEWNSQNELGQTVASGIYFYRLETPRFTESKKMVLLK